MKFKVKKVRLWITILVMIAGEFIVGLDAKNKPCEISHMGILQDFPSETMSEQIWVIVGGDVTAVTSRRYKNNWFRPIEKGDLVTLVIKEEKQYLYYGMLNEYDVRFDIFFFRGLYWLFLMTVIGVLVQFFSLKEPENSSKESLTLE